MARVLHSFYGSRMSTIRIVWFVLFLTCFKVIEEYQDVALVIDLI